MVFAHLFIVEDPDHRQNLISTLLSHPRPTYKISPQFIHNFWSHVGVMLSTNKQIDRHTYLGKQILPRTLDALGEPRYP